MIRLHNLHDSYADILNEEDRDLLHAYLKQERFKEPHQKTIGEGYKLRTIFDLNERTSPIRLLTLIVHDHCQEMIEKFYNDRSSIIASSIISHNLCIEKTEINVTEINSYGYTPIRTPNFNRQSCNRVFVVRYILDNSENRQMSIYSEGNYSLDQPENSLCIFPASPLYQYSEKSSKGQFNYIEFYLRYADE